MQSNTRNRDLHQMHNGYLKISVLLTFFKD